MGDVEDWNQRYLRGEHASAEPSHFLVEVAADLPPGRAFDLACGTGRHALYLAARGWEVSALDGSSVGLALLAQRVSPALAPRIHAACVDLESGPLELAPASFDLVLDFFYLQRSLFPVLAAAVRPGGHFAAAIHLGAEGQPRRVRPGELASYFPGWSVRIDRAQYPEGDKPVVHFLAQRPVAP